MDEDYNPFSRQTRSQKKKSPFASWGCPEWMAGSDAAVLPDVVGHTAGDETMRYSFAGVLQQPQQSEVPKTSKMDITAPPPLYEHRARKRKARLTTRNASGRKGSESPIGLEKAIEEISRYLTVKYTSNKPFLRYNHEQSVNDIKINQNQV